MLVDSMTRLSEHLVDNPTHQLNVFNCLSYDDLRKLTHNLDHEEQHIKRASMRFIALLVGQQQSIKQRFLAALYVTLDNGYVMHCVMQVVLNSFPANVLPDNALAAMRTLKLRSRQFSRLPKNSKERTIMCWVMRLDRPEAVSAYYYENLKELDEVDTNNVLFGIVSSPQKEQELQGKVALKMATERSMHTQPLSNVSNTYRERIATDQAADYCGKDTFRRRIITHQGCYPGVPQNGPKPITAIPLRERIVTLPNQPSEPVSKSAIYGNEEPIQQGSIYESTKPITSVPAFNLQFSTRDNPKPTATTTSNISCQRPLTLMDIPKLPLNDCSTPSTKPLSFGYPSMIPEPQLRPYPNFMSQRNPPRTFIKQQTRVADECQPRPRFQHRKLPTARESTTIPLLPLNT